MKKNNSELILRQLAENIKRLRLDAGYTQEDMINFGFNYRHYQRLESGSHMPSFTTLIRLSESLEVSLSVLFKNT